MGAGSAAAGNVTVDASHYLMYRCTDLRTWGPPAVNAKASVARAAACDSLSVLIGAGLVRLLAQAHLNKRLQNEEMLHEVPVHLSRERMQGRCEVKTLLQRDGWGLPVRYIVSQFAAIVEQLTFRRRERI